MRSSLLSLLCVSLLASSCILAVSADDIVVDDPDVTVLTDDNFAEFVQAELTLVEFYAPWCGHCKSLAPEYALAATALKGLDVSLGKLDATVHSKTASGFSISGYPTLKLFRNGKPFDYNGPRKADGIVAYLKKQVGPSAKMVVTVADVTALQSQDAAVGYVVLALMNSDKVSQLQSSFGMIANRMRDEFVFAKANDATELKTHYGVSTSDEAIVSILHGEVTIYTGSSKTADVESFIRTHSLPAVGEFSDATAIIYQNRKLPLAKLFVHVDRKANSKTMMYITNRLKKLAKQFEGRMLIAYADRTGQKAQMEHLNMQGEENGFMIDDLSVAGGKQYKFEEDEDESGGKKKKNMLNVVGWSAFIESFLSGDADSYVKSERAPKGNLKQPVKMATGQNFDDLVNADDKDVMIEFYAPWCGHCKSLSPKYEELGKKLLSEPGVTIAKMDATANDYDRSVWKVSGYPTIFFKPAGKKAELYEGGREVDAMYEFIKAKGKTIKKGKKGKKAKKQ